MGAVYKARQLKFDRIVALKLIRPERLTDESAIQRFRREIRASAKLDHPNIIRAFDADEVNGVHFFTMEHVEGVDLAKEVKEHGPLPVKTSCEYIRQAALGLQHAHERGMVHRDIKPSNLLVSVVRRPSSVATENKTSGSGDGPRTTDHGQIKILDMGLARLETAANQETTSELTSTGVVMGTPDFLAPEQTRDAHSVDIRADLYSLGCTFYFLLAGRVPFPGNNVGEKLVKHQLDDPIPVGQLRPEVPQQVAAVVRKLMAKKPEERYQTPAELAAVLADPELLKADIAPKTYEAHDTANELPAPLTIPGPRSTTVSAVADFHHRRQAREAAQRKVLLAVSIVLSAMVAIGLVVWLITSGARDLGGAEPTTKPAAQARAAAKTTPSKPATPPLRPVDSAWIKQVATSPPEKQIEAVEKKLQELNPGFSGKLAPVIENGTVVELEFVSNQVKDISPVRALSSLRTLKCAGTQGKATGQLADLSPLRGMRLTSLNCHYTQVRDLSPLKGMHLLSLECGATLVDDLSPLRGMALTYLHCGDTRVDDLSSLKGMPLEGLECWGTAVVDLSPLQGMPLKFLQIDKTKVTDLSPLKGLPLTYLGIRETPADLAQLKGLPLTTLLCDCKSERDAEILRSLKNLEKINGKLAREFFEELGSGKVVAEGPPRALSADEAKQQQEHEAKRLGVPEQITNSIGMRLNLIPAGRFLMGSPENEPGSLPAERPQHEVTISRPFYLGTFEVIQDQYQKVMGSTSSMFPKNGEARGNYPVDMVTWNDAIAFCRKLSDLPDERTSGRVYRLPTESEWEYACRAGTTTAFSCGADAESLKMHVWCLDTAGHTTHPVGQLAPNPWGLYDMHGNVWEYCSDFGDQGDYYRGSPQVDPAGPATGTSRIMRGGSWNCKAEVCCRSAHRWGFLPDRVENGDKGFRVACEIPPPKPLTAAEAKKQQEDEAKRLGVPIQITNSIGIKLNLIPAGRFLMGSPENEPGRQANEGPQHEVAIGKPFHIGIHEVTQAEYEKVTGTNPSKFNKDNGGGPNHPVETVSWDDAVAFCKKLSELPEEKIAGRVYRLPSEAEWEYACRAGSNAVYSFGDDADKLGEYAWYAANSKQTTHPVGQKSANAWGLQDMHGNVWEWCSDWFADAYGNNPKADSHGPSAGTEKVARGSSGNWAALDCRCAIRDHAAPDRYRSAGLGFRVVCEIPGPKPLTAAEAKQQQEDEAKRHGVSVQITNSLGMKLNLIPAGRFLMGSAEDEPGRRPHDGPRHVVTITRPFFIGIHEVTQGDFEQIMGSNPSRFGRVKGGGPDHPVEMVTHTQVIEFCKRLTERAEERKAGRLYRLPTEAEWEYACRAGSKTAYYFGGDRKEADKHAWFPENAGGSTHPVGRLLPNAWGLYDMHGNVWEWCADWFAENYHAAREIADPIGPASGDSHTARGGAWDWSGWRGSGTAACREFAGEAPTEGTVGFRVVCDYRPPQITNSLGMKLARIPAGKFLIGSPENEPGRNNDEDQHEVILTRTFDIGIHKLTVGQFRAFVEDTGYRTEAEKTGRGAFRRIAEENRWRWDATATWRDPKFAQTDNDPVTCVSWNDALAFCSWLSKKEGKKYGLPTEAQWEYACRAGSQSRFYFGDNETDLTRHAWYWPNADVKTHSVGAKESNAWGLFDMYGNAWEWTADWYAPDYYKTSPKQDPSGPETGNNRVVRSAGWSQGVQHCRSAHRNANGDPSGCSTDLGFRVVCEVPAAGEKVK